MRLIQKLSLVFLSSFVLLSTQAHSAERVYNEKFNKQKTNSNWFGANKRLKGKSKVLAKCGPDGSKCLEVIHKPTKQGSDRLTRQISFKGGSAYTLQYDVRFQKKFEWVKGGKLHGLGPNKPITGGKAPTKDGWSARVSFEERGEASLYIYDQSRPKKGQSFGRGVQTKKSVFKSGKWHAVSLYVKINTVGKSNGVAELYLDGKKLLSMDKIKFRAQGKNSSISKFLFSNFYGGNNPTFAPKKTNKIKFDNIAVVKGKSIRKKPIF